MMQVGTWLMLMVCLIWFGCFIYFTAKDLGDEGKKSAIIASGEPLDPYLFSGEKARAEARALYGKDPVVKKYFDENGITPFLTRPE